MVNTAIEFEEEAREVAGYYKEQKMPKIIRKNTKQRLITVEDDYMSSPVTVSASIDNAASRSSLFLTSLPDITSMRQLER